jgi:putative ABC transport system permease protein
MAVGIGAALLSGRLISAFLFDVQTTSPRTFGAVTACLLFVAAVASLGPALRATRVDPMRSLNAE